MTNPFPDLSEAEFQELKDDIAKRGVAVPLFRDQFGNLIDGHQRQRASEELGLPAPPVKVITVKDDAEREEWAIALNTHRRHLTPEQKRKYLLHLATNPVLSQADIAKLVGVSQSTVSETLSKVKPEGVIGTDNSSKATTPKQQAQGKSPANKRGGRPRGNGYRPHPVKNDVRTASFISYLRTKKAISNLPNLVRADKALHEFYRRNNLQCEHSRKDGS